MKIKEGRWSACLACVRPWAPSPAPHTHRRTEETVENDTVSNDSTEQIEK